MLPLLFNCPLINIIYRRRQDFCHKDYFCTIKQLTFTYRQLAGRSRVQLTDPDRTNEQSLLIEILTGQCPYHMGILIEKGRSPHIITTVHWFCIVTRAHNFCRRYGGALLIGSELLPWYIVRESVTMATDDASYLASWEVKKKIPVDRLNVTAASLQDRGQKPDMCCCYETQCYQSKCFLALRMFIDVIFMVFFP